MNLIQRVCTYASIIKMPSPLTRHIEWIPHWLRRLHGYNMLEPSVWYEVKRYCTLGAAYVAISTRDRTKSWNMNKAKLATAGQSGSDKGMEAIASVWSLGMWVPVSVREHEGGMSICVKCNNSNTTRTHKGEGAHKPDHVGWGGEVGAAYSMFALLTRYVCSLYEFPVWILSHLGVTWLLNGIDWLVHAVWVHWYTQPFWPK